MNKFAIIFLGICILLGSGFIAQSLETEQLTSNNILQGKR